MNSCILWKKATSGNGYGATFYKGKQIGAHRLAYIKEYGYIPKGMYVCHKCDIRNCINPKHLFLGYPIDNVRDMYAKGRARPFNPTKVKNGKKPCNRCNEIKPISHFSTDGISKLTGVTRYKPACKLCRRK